MVRRLHDFLSWIVNNPFLQLTTGVTLFAYTLYEAEQTTLHHGFRFFIIWRCLPELLQSLERITKWLVSIKQAKE